MQIKSEHIWVAVFLFVMSGLGYLVWKGWRSMEDTAYQSCIASVMSSIDVKIRYNKIDLSAYELPTDLSWKVLSESQAESLLRQGIAGDCGRTQDVTRDLWNQRVNVALQKTDNRVNVAIWSNGYDGVSGTEDDIAFPYGRFQDGKFRSSY